MEKKIWDDHWERLKEKKNFSRIAGFYRKNIIANTVSRYCDKCFPKNGIFVDAGCGTGQSSQSVPKRSRRLIGVDISRKPLEEAMELGFYDYLLQADINSLSFRDSSLDGIWNVGVMEHLSMEQVEGTLREFYRALKPGAYCIMFWAPKFDLYYFFFAPFEKIIRFFKGKNFQLYPKEITNAKSRKAMKELVLKHSKFRECEVHYSPRDLFTHYAVICRK